MTNETFIDSIAAFKKFGIENSGLTRDEKERAKSGVDCLSSLLKLMQTHPEQNMTVMGLDIEHIRTIKKIAEQYSVEKVVLFPFPNGQNIIPLVRVYGGNKDQFLRYFGWTGLNSNTYLEFTSEYDSLEKEYGIILYEKR